MRGLPRANDLGIVHGRVLANNRATRYTRAGAIRSELTNRAVLAQMPAIFVWLRWIAHDVRRPRRFWPLPAAAMTIVAMIGFFASYWSGSLAETTWHLRPGDGLWLPIVIATTIGDHAAVDHIPAERRGLSRLLALACRNVWRGDVPLDLRAARRRLAAGARRVVVAVGARSNSPQRIGRVCRVALCCLLTGGIVMPRAALIRGLSVLAVSTAGPGGDPDRSQRGGVEERLPARDAVLDGAANVLPLAIPLAMLPIMMLIRGTGRATFASRGAHRDRCGAHVSHRGMVDAIDAR